MVVVVVVVVIVMVVVVVVVVVVTMMMMMMMMYASKRISHIIHVLTVHVLIPFLVFMKLDLELRMLFQIMLYFNLRK